jgi:hypothetical protein
MTRWFLAIGLLLGGALSVAHAEYLRIIYFLNVATNPKDPNSGGDAAGGGLRPPRVPGGPGGGDRPLGPAGGGAGPGTVGEGSGPAGPGGRARPPGGGPGMAPPGAGAPTPQGPGGSSPGGPGGFIPNLRKLLGLEDDEEDNTIQAEVVIEYQKADVVKYYGTNQSIVPYPRIYHKWGKTAIINDLPDMKVEYVQEGGAKLPPVAKRYEMIRKEKLKDGKKVDPLLELAEWALTHAMVEEFGSIMQEVGKLDSKHPSFLAFEAVQSGMKKRITNDEDAIVWKTKLGNNKVKQSAHYTLLYNSPDNEPEEVLTYIDRLEDNYKSFFYWFALKGKTLPIPEKRLVALLVNKPDEFYNYRQVFDNVPLVADGFHDRSENLAVFSSKRLDEVFELVTKVTNPLWQTGWSQESLLKGGDKKGANSADEVVKNQMLALLLKAMQEESALATVSHEGTRQLFVATGLVSRSVNVPEWIQFGEGSFFETPKGAFWPGVGAPSWTYLVKYKQWSKTKRLDRPEEALRKVITDRYFRDARDTKDEAKKTPMLKARTMSWGLVYFLMNRRLDQLLDYYQELNKLPRNLELDDQTLELCFGRAFELTDSPDSNLVNPKKLEKLAAEWYSFLDYTPIESSEALNDAIKKYEQNKKKNQAASSNSSKNQPKGGLKLPKGWEPKKPGK